MGTDMGVELLDLPVDEYGNKQNITTHYANGPIVESSGFPPTVAQLAFYTTEVQSHTRNGTYGVMVDTPSVTISDYGKGRVALNSPHPEMPPTHPDIYAGELLWVLRK